MFGMFSLTPWFVLIFWWLSVNGPLSMFVMFPSTLWALHLTSIFAWIKYALAIFDCLFFFITYHMMDSLKFLHKICGIISANHSCCMQYAYLIYTDSIYEKLLPNPAPLFALFMCCFLDAHQFHLYQASDIITAGDFVIIVFCLFAEYLFAISGLNWKWLKLFLWWTLLLGICLLVTF